MTQMHTDRKKKRWRNDLTGAVIGADLRLPMFWIRFLERVL